MAERAIQAAMISSDSDNRRQIGRRAAIEARDRDCIDDTRRAPIMGTQCLAPGENLRIINGSAGIMKGNLGGIAWSIPPGEQQAFGPFREGRMNLIIESSEDGRPDPRPSIIGIEITPTSEFGDEPIIDGGPETILEWDGSQIWQIGIPYGDEQAEQIAR
jgi:hypothetical protein